MTISGSHTIGGVDGGKGLSVVGPEEGQSCKLQASARTFSIEEKAAVIEHTVRKVGGQKAFTLNYFANHRKKKANSGQYKKRYK